MDDICGLEDRGSGAGTILRRSKILSCTPPDVVEKIDLVHVGSPGLQQLLAHAAERGKSVLEVDVRVEVPAAVDAIDSADDLLDQVVVDGIVRQQVIDVLDLILNWYMMSPQMVRPPGDQLPESGGVPGAFGWLFG